MPNINQYDWLLELAAGDRTEPFQPPTGQPGSFGQPMGSPQPSGVINQNAAPPPGAEPNKSRDPDVGNQQSVADDPQFPDMPEDSGDGGQDFETWRNQYFKDSIKGNAHHLVDLIYQVRDQDLEPAQRKFVEDNLQVQFVRQQANVSQVSKEIRRKLNEELDKNNPGVSLVGHLFDALGSQRLLTDVFIKLNGYFDSKRDLARKYLCALFGGVMVSRADNEDLVINDHDYSIAIAARMNAKFGDFNLGRWALRDHDVERFLSDSDQRKLQHGSPEERNVLRHRLMVESIADRFRKLSFIFVVAGEDGTVYLTGLDLATCLKTGYLSGSLVVRTEVGENSEVFLDDDGNIIPFLDLSIRYVRSTGQVGDDGRPRKKELPFLERKDGIIFLTSPLDVLKDAARGLTGLEVTGIPYQGNPSDLKVLQRCVYSCSELVFRQC